MRSLPLWCAAAWAFGLSALGLFVVPMLFAKLPSPALAGAMAAQLFTVQTGISAVCAVLLLMLLRAERCAVPVRLAQSLTLWVLAGAVLALWVEFGIAPRILARENMALWHGIGSAMYAGQWLCALVVFGKLARSTPV